MCAYNYSGIKIDLHLYNDPYMLAFGMIKPGSNVLDLGCSDGSFAKVLKEELNCKVWGVEVNKQTGEKAQEVCEEVIFADLDETNLSVVFPDQHFDVVTCLDVLEHLKDPVRILTSIKSLIGSEGYVIASIPNIAHISVRLSLLRGQFSYSDFGLLDKTHLKFFTKDSVYDLFEQAGYEIVSFRRVTRNLNETEIKLQLSEKESKLIDDLSNDIEALTYQFSVVAVIKDSPLKEKLLFRPIAYLQDRLRENERRIAEFEVAFNEFQTAITENDKYIEGLQTELLKRELKSNELMVELSQVKSSLKETQINLTNVQEQLQEAQNELNRIKQSRSYKLALRISKLSNLLRRYIKG